MRLANAFCRFVELATDEGGAAIAQPGEDGRHPGFEILTLDLV
jgi:hypothetical protein